MMVMGEDALQGSDDAKETGRLEAFSDGVFAIVITLLALDIKGPPVDEARGALLSALLAQWPIYLGFVTSFATIGIMWINHHLLFKYIRRSNRPPAGTIRVTPAASTCAWPSSSCCRPTARCRGLKQFLILIAEPGTKVSVCL